MHGSTRASVRGRAGTPGKKVSHSSPFAPRDFAAKRAGQAVPEGSAAQLQSELEEEELLQGKSASAQLQAEEEEEEELLQGKSASAQLQAEEEEEEELLQGRFASAQRARSGAATDLPDKDRGLPADLKAGVESLSGMSMDGVKVHYNSPKPAQLDALAYAQGSDIHVGPGHEQHLPHEAWHLVQQAQGRVRPTTKVGSVPVNDDKALEREADVKGAQAVRKGAAERV